MLKWVEITSPRLRTIHQQWMVSRGARLLPGIADYNHFAELQKSANAPSCSVLICIPPGGARATIKHRGDAVRDVVRPDVLDGMALAVSPAVGCDVVVLPFRQVCTTRQPDCRRGESGNRQADSRYEILLLPFDDGRLRVCLIHATFDITEARAREA